MVCCSGDVCCLPPSSFSSRLCVSLPRPVLPSFLFSRRDPDGLTHFQRRGTRCSLKKLMCPQGRFNQPCWHIYFEKIMCVYSSTSLRACADFHCDIFCQLHKTKDVEHNKHQAPPVKHQHVSIVIMIISSLALAFSVPDQLHRAASMSADSLT